MIDKHKTGGITCKFIQIPCKIVYVESDKFYLVDPVCLYEKPFFDLRSSAKSTGSKTCFETFLL